MAITVSGKNFVQFSGCTNISDGGAWTGVDTPDTVDFKEGTASLCGTFRLAGTQDAHFVPTGSKNLFNKHVRIWIMDIFPKNRDTYANGGYQFYCSDGTNTGYWYVGGKATNPGGWWNIVVDLSKAVDAGTKPSDAGMQAITSMGIRVKTVTSTKNVDNFWVDNLCVCDGLITYGDKAGGYYDFEDIFAICDNPTTGGLGVMTKKTGIYCLVGSIEFGAASANNGTKFQAKSQVVVFENRPNKDGTLSNINVNLMKFTVVDYGGTAITEFVLGEKSGTQGISGCMVRTQTTAQIAKFAIDGSTDTDVDNFKLYGCTFLDAGTISFPASATNVEVLNCNFEKCGQIVPDTCVVKYCNFISSKSTVDAAVLINDDPHYVTDSNFISCPKGVEIDAYGDGEYDFINLQFSGCDFDVNNSCGQALTVANSGSNASTYTGSAVSFITSVQLTITVTNEAGGPILGAFAYIDDNDQTPYIMNTTTDDEGEATVPYSGSPVTDARWRVRKYGYKNFKQLIDIASENINLPVMLVVDPQQT